jgi:hypothetical protein
MEILKKQLADLINSLSKAAKETIQHRLADLISVYPFNEYEYVISTLLGLGKITLDNYFEMRDEYISRNMFLYIFEIAGPRTFGEQWAQGHLKELVPDLVKPTKRIDSNYSGQYDFLLKCDGEKYCKIEVKASRAVDGKSREQLAVKALAWPSEKPFDMNFQQVKPGCCDVFVWVGVWRDVIKHWILTSKEVETNPFYSTGQHRGNVGEGQLHINRDNIKKFEKYVAESDKILQALKNAYHRQIAK